MALSEEERRRLEMLEQELASTDPDLDRTLQTGAHRLHSREGSTMVRGILTTVAAFALVIVGIATELIIIGILGFVLMLAGAHWFIKGLGPGSRPEETLHDA
ncbi:DUF3040 domain-containing protein [Paenarthrobacter sp.]|uniref:DUF3040 domain-containing protein n=1 Tax=Paenarthrobacter sp. TaxID=1931993 RepID=UPI0028125AA7|nr:DUF3040 domain-containing protein [Paenarthrobacter sp.]